jgi:hypothetical protein
MFRIGINSFGNERVMKHKKGVKTPFLKPKTKTEIVLLLNKLKTISEHKVKLFIP